MFFSADVPLQEGGQERTLHPAHLQEPLRNQQNIFLPVHAPLIISLNNAEDEEDDEGDDDKENYVSDWVPKTAAEMEEERTIKEICYKTGEYYRIQYPHKHQSAETVSSAQEKEILLLEAMERDLQKGSNSSDPKGKPSYHPRSRRQDDETAASVPRGRAAGRKTDCDSSEPRRPASVFYRRVGGTREPKFKGSAGDGDTAAPLNSTEKGESSGRRVPAERVPSRNWRSFDNGGIRSSDPNVKPSYQQGRKNKAEETASSVPYVRGAGRKTDSDSLEPRRSTYVFYRTVNVAQEPKFNGSTGGFDCDRFIIFNI
ncbi:uncharacterized protein C12orf50 homolog [Patagioenas fasciata]|uniref:uncharacterized protein C12orf50 homolog n=1 Tax=Patagioenas fasciata TaxID=372321 RepID=UPI003A98D77A